MKLYDYGEYHHPLVGTTANKFREGYSFVPTRILAFQMYIPLEIETKRNNQNIASVEKLTKRKFLSTLFDSKQTNQPGYPGFVDALRNQKRIAIIVEEEGGNIFGGYYPGTVKKVYNSLEGFKEIVSPSILSWLAGVFDKDTGAFYFANSSRNMEKSEPFIESTAFALEFLKTSGVFTASELKNGTYPAVYKERAVDSIKSLQGDDLYFYQNIWGEDVSTTRRNRDLSFARQVLSSFGESAMYPDTVNVSDVQLLAVDDIRDYLESEEKMKIYLDSLDWSKKGIWSTGDKLSSSKSVIASAGLLDFVREYIKNKQNTETGLWAEGCDMQNINGAMKLSSYFTKASPYPNIDKMADSVIEVLKDETKLTSSTSLWNPVELLNRAIGSYGDSLPFKTKKKITDGMEYIVDLLIKHTAKFKKSDGGYSSYPQKSSSAMMGYPASLGMEESDMDATIIIGIRLAGSVYGVLDLKMPKYLSEYKDEFLSSLLAEGAAK